MPQCNHANRDERGYFLPGHKLGGRPIGRGNKDYKVHKSLKEVREALKIQALIDAEPLYAAVRDKALKTGSEKKAEYCNKFAGLHKDYIETDLPQITDTASALEAIAKVVAKVADGDISVGEGKVLVDTISRYVNTYMRGRIADTAMDMQGIFASMIRGIGVSDLEGQIIDEKAEAALNELVEEGVIEPRGMAPEDAGEPVQRDCGSGPKNPTQQPDESSSELLRALMTDAQRNDIEIERQRAEAKAEAERKNREVGRLVSRK